MKHKDLWLEILTTYVKRFGFTSITIPNMIAVYSQSDNNLDLTSYQCVKKILQDMVTTESVYRVLIQKCPEIQQYTFSIFRGVDQNNIDGRIFFNMYDEYLKVNGEYTIEGVAKKLYEIYKGPILSNLFSYDKYNRTWRELNAIEAEAIKEILVKKH